MTIEFHCPHCNKLLRTHDDKAGHSARCPGCGAEITVPEWSTAETTSSSGGSSSETAPKPEFQADRPAAVPPPPPPGTAMKQCPMCGEQIRAAAIRCRYCGEDISGAGATEGAPVQTHRGTLILVFGILSWVVTCPIFGIVAWIMGNSDLREMNVGRMDPTGEGLTKAGKIIGMIHVLLTAAAILLWCFAVIVFGIAEGLT